jgi:hypothetical protein
MRAGTKVSRPDSGSFSGNEDREMNSGAISMLSLLVAIIHGGSFWTLVPDRSTDYLSMVI